MKTMVMKFFWCLWTNFIKIRRRVIGKRYL